MSLYSMIKKSWRTVMPLRAREALFHASPAPIKRMRRSLIAGLEKTAQHDEIYDADYYTSLVDPTMQISADTIADAIVAAFSPRTIADIGCGTGVLMLALQKRGVSCQGFEYSAAALETCRKRGLQVTPLNIETDPIPAGVRVDVAISTEVAEHLPESCADRFLDVLTALSDTVVLTAADTSPHSSTDHVNEQPLSYWIAKMDARGYTYLESLTEGWRPQWRQAGVAACFFDAIMAFSKKK